MSQSYVDTSVFVAALLQEAHTARAEQWLTAGGGLAISEWTITEFSSALSTRQRMGTIESRTRRGALDAFAVMVANSLTVFSVESRHFRTAAQFIDEHRLGLRAPDGLHLAVSADNGATLVTLDKRLATAGKALGVPVRLL